MTGKSKTLKVKFQDGSSTSLTIIDYKTSFEGILKIGTFLRMSLNTYVLPTETFKAKTEEELLKSVKQYLKNNGLIDFEIS